MYKCPEFLSGIALYDFLFQRFCHKHGLQFIGRGFCFHIFFELLQSNLSALKKTFLCSISFLKYFPSLSKKFLPFFIPDLMVKRIDQTRLIETSCVKFLTSAFFQLLVHLVKIPSGCKSLCQNLQSCWNRFQLLLLCFGEFLCIYRKVHNKVFKNAALFHDSPPFPVINKIIPFYSFSDNKKKQNPQGSCFLLL